MPDVFHQRLGLLWTLADPLPTRSSHDHAIALASGFEQDFSHLPVLSQRIEHAHRVRIGFFPCGPSSPLTWLTQLLPAQALLRKRLRRPRFCFTLPLGLRWFLHDRTEQCHHFFWPGGIRDTQGAHFSASVLMVERVSTGQMLPEHTGPLKRNRHLEQAP